MANRQLDSITSNTNSVEYMARDCAEKITDIAEEIAVTSGSNYKISEKDSGDFSQQEWLDI